MTTRLAVRLLLPLVCLTLAQALERCGSEGYAACRSEEPTNGAITSVVLDTVTSRCRKWPAARWAAEVQAMQAIGIEHVILSPLLRSADDGSNLRLAYYNTSLPGTRVIGDCAAPLLAAAAAAAQKDASSGKASFTVSLGLERRSFAHVNGQRLGKRPAALRFFKEVLKANTQVAAELLGRFRPTYGSAAGTPGAPPPVLAGLHNPQDLDDHFWGVGPGERLYDDYVLSCLMPLHRAINAFGATGSLTAKLRGHWAANPAAAAAAAADGGGWGPPNVTAFWARTLGGVPVGLDVLLVRDGFGEGSGGSGGGEPSWADPSQVGPLYRAVALAAEAAVVAAPVAAQQQQQPDGGGGSVAIWAGIELFDRWPSPSPTSSSGGGVTVSGAVKAGPGGQQQGQSVEEQLPAAAAAGWGAERLLGRVRRQLAVAGPLTARQAGWEWSADLSPVSSDQRPLAKALYSFFNDQLS